VRVGLRSWFSDTLDRMSGALRSPLTGTEDERRILAHPEDDRPRKAIEAAHAFAKRRYGSAPELVRSWVSPDGAPD
jgi:hypothetical protein